MKDTLWGENLYDYLDDIYRNKALYCVFFISSYYARKVWTNHERKSAQARALKENRAYILPVKLDDTEISGLTETIGYHDLRNSSIQELAELTIQKVNKIKRKKQSSEKKLITKTSELVHGNENKKQPSPKINEGRPLDNDEIDLLDQMHFHEQRRKKLRITGTSKRLKQTKKYVREKIIEFTGKGYIEVVKSKATITEMKMIILTDSGKRLLKSYSRENKYPIVLDDDLESQIDEIIRDYKKQDHYVRNSSLDELNTLLTKIDYWVEWNLTDIDKFLLFVMNDYIENGSEHDDLQSSYIYLHNIINNLLLHGYDGQTVFDFYSGLIKKCPADYDYQNKLTYYFLRRLIRLSLTHMELNPDDYECSQKLFLLIFSKFMNDSEIAEEFERVQTEMSKLDNDIKSEMKQYIKDSYNDVPHNRDNARLYQTLIRVLS